MIALAALLGVPGAFASESKCRLGKMAEFPTIVADSRGLVLLRSGAYDKSLADYEASLMINPNNAWSLYGRGIDELRKNKVSMGQVDMAQATQIQADIADEFNRHGIVP
jgi:hypothetical protein